MALVSSAVLPLAQHHNSFSMHHVMNHSSSLNDLSSNRARVRHEGSLNQKRAMEGTMRDILSHLPPPPPKSRRGPGTSNKSKTPSIPPLAAVFPTGGDWQLSMVVLDCSSQQKLCPGEHQENTASRRRATGKGRQAEQDGCPSFVERPKRKWCTSHQACRNPGKVSITKPSKKFPNLQLRELFSPWPTKLLLPESL